MRSDDPDGRAVSREQSDPNHLSRATKSRSTGRLLRPLACAVAAAGLPVVLPLATPAASKALLTPGDIRTSAAPAETGTPTDQRPTHPANVPWELRAGRLVLHGSTFHGVVTVRTTAGSERVLKFTARSLDIVDLGLSAGHGRAAMRLRAKPATTSTATGKEVVTLYTQKLSGTVTSLDGAPLPADRSVTLTPDTLPPWLPHPTAPTRTLTFENVTASQVAPFNGTLSITGAAFNTADE
ncbi:hypothetical protein [Streptomyces sp. NBC_01408]|uniref:hypothetical protein n=1 Tax=Streptomyces sp. NBC_01408 TaxID=2903855 RepID=UPI002251EE28|nr:hypothetical protein [Streptomyces sp. NBC_01408]MCX4695670.1 hypothetical protein [Streptomyces sp. NBC_01408]